MATAAATLAWDFITGGTSIIRSPYEAEEMKEYPIYFIPRKRYIHCGEYNNGFDDENSCYVAQVGDHIQYRYEVECKLGSGAFGECWRVFDHKTGNRVALKMIRNERRFLMQGRIEVQMLENVRNAATENHCVQMIDNFTFRSHLCITFNLLSHDLLSELKTRDFNGIPVANARAVITRLLKCLRLLKEEEIVHADLKPENILFDLKKDFSDVTVIDLGSACYEHGKIHTYVQSRYYRSPEIVLGSGYGCPIDMWSLGCILGELIGGRPIFPAKSEHDLLLFHMQLLGAVPHSLLEKAGRTHDFFEQAEDGCYNLRTLIDQRGIERKMGSRCFDSLCKSSLSMDPQLEDFLRQCLTFDPADRLTPTQALQHPWITTTSPSDGKRDEAVILTTTATSPELMRKRVGSHGSSSVDSGVDSSPASNADTHDTSAQP